MLQRYMGFCDYGLPIQSSYLYEDNTHYNLMLYWFFNIATFFAELVLFLVNAIQLTEDCQTVTWQVCGVCDWWLLAAYIIITNLTTTGPCSHVFSPDLQSLQKMGSLEVPNLLLVPCWLYSYHL